MELAPLVEALKTAIISQSVLHADETPVKMLVLERRKPRRPMSERLPPPDGAISKRWFMTSNLLGREKWLEPSLMTGTDTWSATITEAKRPASSLKTMSYRQR